MFIKRKNGETIAVSDKLGGLMVKAGLGKRVAAAEDKKLSEELTSEREEK